MTALREDLGFPGVDLGAGAFLRVGAIGGETALAGGGSSGFVRWHCGHTVTGESGGGSAKTSTGHEIKEKENVEGL